MRYAIVSDLHANLQAWNAVLLDIRSNRVDHIICLGDVVGYGPSPAEVLQSAHENIHSFVMGNHDAVVCGKLADTLFHEHAREAIRRTRRQLGAPAGKFLAGFPLLLDGGSFLCAHGDFTSPESFQYILDAGDAANSWRAVPNPLLFAGHTHEPALYLCGSSGTPHAVPPQDFELEAEKRYLVNVGSVGCSRDSDPRASYCIYDAKMNAVFWRRIPYDLDAHRREYEQAGLDPAASVVLNADPRRGSVPLRERLDFAPATHPGEAAVGVTEVAMLRTLQRRARLWRITAAALLCLLGFAGAALGLWWQRTSVRPLRLGGPPPDPLPLRAPGETANLLSIPQSPVARNTMVPGWTILLGDSRCQSAEVALESNGAPVFVLTSGTAQQPVHILPPPMEVAPGMSFYPDMLFFKSPDFSGTVGISVTLFREGDPPGLESRLFYTQEPGLPRSDGWARARRKFVIPAKGCRIQVRIGGQFTGTVKIKDPALLCSKPSHERTLQ